VAGRSKNRKISFDFLGVLIVFLLLPTTYDLKKRGFPVLKSVKESEHPNKKYDGTIVKDNNLFGFLFANCSAGPGAGCAGGAPAGSVSSGHAQRD
jgi:hypothetical protein